MKKIKSIFYVLWIMICIAWNTEPVLSQQPLDQLTLKGTHNSYACCGGGFGNCFFNINAWDNSCPVAHNPMHELLDDWNIWYIELDFNPVLINGNLVLMVGHDGYQGDDSWTDPSWGTTMEDFLKDIRDSRSFAYHPVFLKLEQKNGGSGQPNYWGAPGYDNPDICGPLVDNLLLSVFGSDHIFGPDALNQNGGKWPTVPLLSGKVIPYMTAGNPNYNSGYGSSLIGTGALLSLYFKSGYSNANERNVAIQAGNHLIVMNEYQQDWTFDGTAPPNPVYIQNGAPPTFSVVNQYGHNCCDFNDTGETFQVAQHGTFRFPFDRIDESVDTALPGWTLLIHTGSYPEHITISKPITLKADGGPVIIGN